MGKPIRSEAIMIERRRNEALQMHLMGVRPDAIGRKLAADPAINSDGESYPYGYGRQNHEQGKPPPDRETLVRLVWRDLTSLMRRATSSEDIEALRATEFERLEQLHRVAWAKAMTGDPYAVQNVLRIADRRAKLLGLDMPLRAETKVMIRAEDPKQELERLEQAFAKREELTSDQVLELMAGD